MCLPAVQEVGVTNLAKTCLSQDAVLKDGEKPGQVPPKWWLRCDPKNADLQVPDIQSLSIASAILAEAVKSLLPISQYSTIHSQY